MRSTGGQEVQQPRRGDRGQAQGAQVQPAGEGGVGGVGGVGSNGDGEGRNESDNDGDNGHSRPGRARTGEATEAKVSPHVSETATVWLSLLSRGAVGKAHP